MGSGDQSGRVAETQRFRSSPRRGILADDRTRFLVADETEVGWIARTGHVPLGYLDDEARDQRRRSRSSTACGWRLPATARSYTADGQVVLLGRDSLVVNTGGEKVFVEEVEDVLKRHDARGRRARHRSSERALRSGSRRRRPAHRPPTPPRRASCGRGAASTSPATRRPARRRSSTKCAATRARPCRRAWGTWTSIPGTVEIVEIQPVYPPMCLKRRRTSDASS